LAVGGNYHHYIGYSYVFERKFQQLGCLLCFCSHGIGNILPETFYEKAHGKAPGFFEQSKTEITVQTQSLDFQLIFS
jgi:hypothetical protein